MIKFFRKIRRKLIEEGNLKKYLVYAVGEILLVVIGILIALQINNWNNSNMTTSKERILLQELKANLIANIDGFNKNIEVEKDRIVSIDILLNHLENNLPYNDSLNSHFVKTIFLERISISSSAYKTLNSTGLDAISSDTLRMAIMRLYEVLYPLEVGTIETVGLALYSNRFLPNISPNLLFNKDMTASPVNYSQLQEEGKFANWLLFRRFWKVGVLYKNERFIVQTKEVIYKLTEYLKTE